MLCVQARHAALEALVQYPASDILHCQYFVAVKDAMLAALQEPRMQVTAYIQFAAVCLHARSCDNPPVLFFCISRVTIVGILAYFRTFSSVALFYDWPSYPVLVIPGWSLPIVLPATHTL